MHCCFVDTWQSLSTLHFFLLFLWMFQEKFVTLCRKRCMCKESVMSTQMMTQKLKEYFKTQPVLKAWLFGSYARGEETEDSDVDLLVAYDDTEDVSLFTIGGIYMDLKKILGHEVDLVEEGTLRPWAAATVDRDKILIYEREGSRQGTATRYS